MRIMMKMIRKQKIERIDYLWVMRQQVVKAWKFCFSLTEADLLKIFLFFKKKWSKFSVYWHNVMPITKFKWKRQWAIENVQCDTRYIKTACMHVYVVWLYKHTCALEPLLFSWKDTCSFARHKEQSQSANFLQESALNPNCSVLH